MSIAKIKIFWVKMQRHSALPIQVKGCTYRSMAGILVQNGIIEGLSQKKPFYGRATNYFDDLYLKCLSGKVRLS